MSNQNSDATGESDEKLLTTRRAIVASILGAGAIGAAGGRSATGPDNSVAGGGSMADPNAQYHVDVYEGTLSERPSAGVDGRYWRVEDPGTDEHGNVYEDTGSGWQLLDLGVGSFSTEQSFTESRGPSVVVHEAEGGTIVADGPDSELASGDINTPSDVTTVLQTALDEGGHVTVKSHSSNYQMGVGGQDAEGEDYCLQMRASTKLEIEEGATLEYPSSGSSDLSTPILCSGINQWQICGEGTVDAGYHVTPQDSITANIMGIKVGVRGQASATACNHWRIEGVTVTGAYRHGIESIDGASHGIIEDVLLDDASGDDGISISVNCYNVHGIGVTAININRSGPWDSGCFEIEDGAISCSFRDCHALDSDVDGFHIGKVHEGDPVCKDVGCIDCTAKNLGGYAFIVTGPTTDNVTCKRYYLRDCRSDNCSQGVFIAINTGTMDVVVDGGYHTNCDGKAVTVSGGGDGTLDGLDLRNLKCRNPGDNGIFFNPTSTTTTFKDITVEQCEVRGSPKNGLIFKETAARYAGDNVVRNNRFGTNSWNDIQRSTDTGTVFRTIENDTADDFTGAVPASPSEGDWYLDDGTNTKTGTPGKRVYIGGSWVDAYEAGPASYSVGSGSSQTLNNGAAYSGLISLSDETNDAHGVFLLGGASGSVTEIADPSGHFGTASGSGNNIDVVWDSTNSRYQIENATASSATVEVRYPARE